MTAGLRLVALASARKQTTRARRLLEEIAGSPAAQGPEMQAMIPALRVRLASAGGDDAEIDRQIASTPPTIVAPVLIRNPPIPLTSIGAAEKSAHKFFETTGLSARSMEVTALEWADIGYWIRPSGHTAGVSVLRSSRDSDWRAATDQISGRRYAAFGTDPAGQGIYKVERYTLRGSYGVPIGSLIRRRTGQQQMEVVDITQGATPPPT